MGCDPVETVRWASGAVRILDQRALPGSVEYLDCRTVSELAHAIRTLAVRGAPAIGIAAAYGAALAALSACPGPGFAVEVEAGMDLLEATRPTAVNLSRALASQRAVFRDPGNSGMIFEALLANADSILAADLEASRLMGRHGASLLGPGSRLLTHCNAGALATGGLGTALAVFYEAWDRGLLTSAFADETRPLLQGSRLTAWELARAGIPVTVLPDSAAAGLLASGAVDAVFTGADRIACNGDVANKLGTYPLALAAREAGIPFYVVAPLSTFDPWTPDGPAIPIEQRDGGEVTSLGGCRTAPAGVSVYNPAFDVTPARLVSAYVCELGAMRGSPNDAMRALTGGS